MNPSFQEGLPTTVIEALISGCRVIATDVGGTREILRYAPFILVAPNNIHAIAMAIESLVSSPELEKPAMTLSLFSWDQTFREFREVYSSD